MDRSRQGGGGLPMATRKHTYHKEFYTITNTQISSSDLQYLFNVRTGINFSCENGDGDSCRGRGGGGGGPGSPPDLAGWNNSLDWTTGLDYWLDSLKNMVLHHFESR